MTSGVQDQWIRLSSAPDPRAAVATWWAQARTSLFSPTLLPVANAGIAHQIPATPPAPSLPPSPQEVGSWRICPAAVSVRWALPPSPAAPTLSHLVVVAESVRDTLTLPPIDIAASPPANAGIAQFPSEFRITGYDGAPIATSKQDGAIAVQLVATPVAYLWDFGDGSGTTAGPPGTGAALSITHSFTRSSASSPLAAGGKYAVRISVVFDTKFSATAPGTTPGWQDFSSFGLAPLVDTTTLPYEVDQVYGVLVPAAPGQ